MGRAGRETTGAPPPRRPAGRSSPTPRRGRDPTKTIRYLETKEVAALFEVLGRQVRRTRPREGATAGEAYRLARRDLALFRLAYHHGLRASEIGKLRHADVDLAGMKLHRVERLKGSRTSQNQPLDPDDALALRSHFKLRFPHGDDGHPIFLSRNRKPISRIRLHELMHRYGDEAGIPPEKRHFHALKHSIAVHMLQAGAHFHEIQDHLGHANVRNTTLYAQFVKTPEQQARLRRIFDHPAIAR